MMNLKVYQVLRQTGNGQAVELNYNFLGTGLARKVYIVDLSCVLRIPEQGAHFHNSGHTLIPLLGESRVAYQDERGETHIIPMEVGKYYYIPPAMIHQVEVRGVLESYFPAWVFTRRTVHKLVKVSKDLFAIEKH